MGHGQDCVCRQLGQRAFFLDRGLPPGIRLPALEMPQAPRNFSVWSQASAQFMLLPIFASRSFALPFISLSLKTDYGILQWCCFTLFF